MTDEQAAVQSQPWIPEFEHLTTAQRKVVLYRASKFPTVAEWALRDTRGITLHSEGHQYVVRIGHPGQKAAHEIHVRRAADAERIADAINLAEEHDRTQWLKCALLDAMCDGDVPWINEDGSPIE